MKKRHLKRLLGVAMYEIDNYAYLYKREKERAERMEDEDAGRKQEIARVYAAKNISDKEVRSLRQVSADQEAEIKRLSAENNELCEAGMANKNKFLSVQRRCDALMKEFHEQGKALKLAKEQLAERQTEVNLLVAEIEANE